MVAAFVATWRLVAVWGPAMITDLVRDFYVTRWGEPSRTTTFGVADLTVEVFKWNADANPEGVNLYATVGASARPMAGRDQNHRVEFFVGLLPAKDEIASPLAALALYPTREGTPVEHGHTVPAEEPLWPGTDMRRFLVLRQLGDVIPPLELPDGEHVEFLQAIPIFDSELAYKSEHNSEGLLRLWQESRVSFWDPNRAPEPAVN